MFIVVWEGPKCSKHNIPLVKSFVDGESYCMRCAEDTIKRIQKKMDLNPVQKQIKEKGIDDSSFAAIFMGG